MNEKRSKLLISDSIGEVSLILNEPANPIAALVLAHGAGAGMTHPFMKELASLLEQKSIATIRYNFPFIEKKSKRPDVPAVAEKTVGVVLEYAKGAFPNIPVFLGGKSFGGRMSSQFVSKNAASSAAGIVFYGFPLHPPGKAGTERAEHLKAVKIPMLFLQGTRDALATFSMIESVCEKLPTAGLVGFEGADHSFKSKGKILLPELANATVKWISDQKSGF